MRSCLAAALVFVLSACASGRGPGSAARSVDGVGGFYAGSLVVDGRSFGAALNLRGSGPSRVEGVFSTSSPIEIEGDADGAVMDGLLRLVVAYRTPDGCAGRIQGILDVSRDGDALDGPVTVSDCEAPVAGQLTLRRRGVTGPGEAGGAR